MKRMATIRIGIRSAGIRKWRWHLRTMFDQTLDSGIAFGLKNDVLRLTRQRRDELKRQRIFTCEHQS